jgi:hypothetical protein
MREISTEICAHRSAERRTTCLSAEYWPEDRYWHSVSPSGLPAGKIPRSGERCAHQPHELPEAKRRAKFMGLMSTPNGVTQEFYRYVLRNSGTSMYLTAHPPFSTAVKIPPIYGSLKIRRTSTVEDFLPYFYCISTSRLPPWRQDLMMGAKASTSFYFSTSRLPPFYLSSASLPPVYLSTSCLPLFYLSTSRLPLYLPPPASLFPLPPASLYLPATPIEPFIVPLMPHSELLPA